MVIAVRGCALLAVTCASAIQSPDTVTFPFNKPTNAHYKSVSGSMSSWKVFEMECFHFLYSAVGKEKSSGELRNSLKALCVKNDKECDTLTSGILSAVDAKYAKSAKRPYRDWCTSVFVGQGGVVPADSEETHKQYPHSHHETEAVEAKAMRALAEAHGAAGAKALASNPYKVARRASKQKHIAEAAPTKVNPTAEAKAPPAPKVKAPHHGPPAPKVKAKAAHGEAAHREAEKVVAAKTTKVTPKVKETPTKQEDPPKVVAAKTTKLTHKMKETPTKHEDPPKVEVPEDVAATPVRPKKSLRQIFGETVDGSAAGIASGIEGLAIADKAQETHASASEMKSADDLLDGALGAAKSLGKKHHSDHSMMRWRRRI